MYNGNHVSRRRVLKSTAGVGAAVGIAGCLGGGEQFLTIGTGGTGGVYYPLGGGIADILNQELDVDATAESTGASAENSRLVGNEEMEMALALGNTVQLAVDGEDDFDDEIPLKAAFGAYVNHTQVVVPEDSDVETLDDLEGLDVSVGAPGSGTEVIAEELLEWYGLSFDDINDERLSFSETSSALQDDNIDAGFWSVAYPASSIEELASQRDVRMLDFPESDLEAITDDHPYYAAAEIPAGTYPDQEEAIANPGVTNTMIVHEEMDDELLYDVVEAIFTNLDELEDIHQVAEQFEESVYNAPIDLHPGAEDYFDDNL
ncbi:TAXI family TRAP transporter solute-binding subunit [Natronolimnohabitans sp. A-GB9]|uniref:TAXI family TRAP transporter solute-binding subunit n=1 Tax=Natronolimnohabitans sp. A-GB9 TaxID=3069757 RepID=UPI0027B76CF6|nr:TAXI family TRAP transporter solute-binding subunit [Natronolimnohabitans sp. A-GB9]MDQ2052810.1 TAXI family TRAP transporter solute-binding subunit [Natronolimnohabitans sp. A-GB9]